MAAPKKTVDEIWRELNARPLQPPRSGAAATGIPGFGLPGVSTRTRVLPSKAHGAAPLPAADDAPLAARGGPRPAPAYDPAAAGVSAEEVQTYLAGLQRTLNCLADPDRGTRRAAMAALSARLLRGDAAAPKASPAMLQARQRRRGRRAAAPPRSRGAPTRRRRRARAAQALLAGPLAHPLAGLLADPVESVRLSALTLLLEGARQVADPTALLPGLLPALRTRMGVCRCWSPPRSALAPAADDLAALLARGLEDAFPDAKRAAAAALGALAERLPPRRLEDQAERLLQSLLPNLAHQHSKVRLAMLAGLRSLVLSGLPAGAVGGTLAPALRPLAFDHSPSVRESYYAALAAWLGCAAQPAARAADGGAEAAGAGAADAAHAQCRTHAPALLPLLLLGVSDPVDGIAAAALAALEQAGAAWLALPAAAAAGDSGGGEPMDADGPGAAAAAAAAAPDLAASAEAVAAAQLPPPFDGLPGEPCRRMVVALLPQLLPGVLAGLKEWTATLRSAAARTLHAVLVLAGPAAAPHLGALLPALIGAMGEEEPDIVARLAACARALGALAQAGAWLPLLVDALTDAKAGPGARANALVVGSCLVHAAAAARQAGDPRLLGLLVGALAGEELRHSDHAGVQAQALSLASALIAWAPPEVVVEHGQALHLVLLQLHGNAAAAGTEAGGADADAAAAADRAAAALQRLADACGLADAGALAAAHGRALLRALAADADGWTAGSPNLQAVMSLLRTAGPDALAELLPAVAEVLAPLLADADRDPGLRLALLRLLDGLLEGKATGAAFARGGNAALALRALLVPPLVWRAGKVGRGARARARPRRAAVDAARLPARRVTPAHDGRHKRRQAAAAVRFAAITALATLLARRLAPPEALLAAAAPAGGLLPLLAQCLDDDWYADLRHTACYVTQALLEQVGASLDDEARRALYPELLKRLDDSANKVRVAACASLVAFVRAAGPGYCATNAGYLAAGVVIHMDDGDALVAEAACQVLEALAATHPRVAAAEVGKVAERFRARHYCDRVLAAAARGGATE
ncbi:Dnaaf5 [Scenedesmus sp. PABB004]|nr:Dnaaf5 [Scenedesmus sp. PABB004]